MFTFSLKDLLCNAGRPENRLSDAEFNQMLDGAPLDQKGNLDVVAFSKLIKRGKEDDE
jgi:Ca2+-binding EF-hand superfamily protein